MRDRDAQEQWHSLCLPPVCVYLAALLLSYSGYIRVRSNLLHALVIALTKQEKSRDMTAEAAVILAMSSVSIAQGSFNVIAPL